MHDRMSVIKASDADAWIQCRRRVWLDHYPPSGLEPVIDRFDALIQQKGIAHELQVRAALDASIEARDAAHTRELMAQRIPVIYQPVLEDARLGVLGKPDFLVLTESGEYQVVDAKLARSLGDHKEIKIQLAVYRALIGNGLPALAWLPEGTHVPIGAECDALAESFLTDMRDMLTQVRLPEADFSYSRCTACPYHVFCRPTFEAAQALTLVYGVDSRIARGLRRIGITSIPDLAAADPDSLPDIPYLKDPVAKQKVVYQAQSRLNNTVITLGEPQLPTGTYVHFDVEANPLSERFDNEVYLWGLLAPPYDHERFIHSWSDAGAGHDRAAWVAFLGHVETLKTQYPDLRLIHYSPYEVTQIRAYTARYAMEDHPVVQWLLNGGLFDIAKTVTDALILPLDSYGLKHICKHPDLVNFQWELKESGSQWSVVRYIDYLQTADANERSRIREEILTYNRDDVLATAKLVDWLQAQC